jgi:hypothetical protein
MILRSLCLSACLLALAAEPPREGQSKQAQAPAGKASNVYYRAKGEKEWSLFGYYASESSARQVIEHLGRTGFEAEVRPGDTPIPRFGGAPPSTANLPVTETVTHEKATEVFSGMARQTDIAFRFPLDGCYARTQLMVERMQKQGLKPRRVWAVANGEELYARTKNHPKGYVTWGYHVAPVLRVRGPEGKQRWYVIDPSLFEAPATLAQWMYAQMRKREGHRPFVTVTKLGEAPVWVDRKKKDGTGYWPSADPKEGAHKHAVATMKKYKPWEGKSLPKGAVRLGPGGLRDALAAGRIKVPCSATGAGRLEGFSSCPCGPACGILWCGYNLLEEGPRDEPNPAGRVRSKQRAHVRAQVERRRPARSHVRGDLPGGGALPCLADRGQQREGSAGGEPACRASDRG